MDSIFKIKYTLDALFGLDVSKHLPKNVRFTYSKKTGRIQHVYQRDTLLCTLRIDGGLAITPKFAQILVKSKKFRENCVEIDDDSKPFVEKGNSVFCNHITRYGKSILIGSDVPVLYGGKVIAVGRAIVSSKMMHFLKKGVAVKIRNSLKVHEEER
jgi:uncharacterized protein with predicted RNA binding PUA domain